MSRFSSAFIIGSSLALFSPGAPLAFAQPAPADVSTISASRVVPGAVTSQPKPITMQVHQTANTCFTDDLVPDDDSSMLTVCGANGPSMVIYGQ